MLSFQEYSSDRRILEMLCRLRIKLAHRRNQDHLVHLHTMDPQYNYHNKRQSNNEELLCSLFPPRKKWKTVGENKRKKDGVPRNSSEKNMLALLSTIKYYERCDPHNPFLTKLNTFIQEIQECIHFNSYKISSPKIIPKLKNDKVSEIEMNVCRPIASFGLKDKIILSITNRYLTNILDPCFSNQSFAFRAKRLINGNFICPTHHDPVEEIIAYRRRFQGNNLYVAECDMKKFFDTVNHTIIKKVFSQLLSSKKLSKCHPNDIYNAKRILHDYLDVYSFNKSVFPLNFDQGYFKKFKIPLGEFGWVEDELISSGYYKRIHNAKIGIPQGGALSGLIANAVLNGVDRKVSRHQDGALLYVRFCDDMLIIHPDPKKCSAAFDEYLKGLEAKKLVVHQPVSTPYRKPSRFWNEKSKSCYKWGDEPEVGSSWIGFVGYEIHYEGHLRVRKSSLVKEMKKQYRVVGDLKVILNNLHCRSSKNAIYESVAKRLIGMSVGRVNLWNYKDVKSEMCWTSGYKALNDNKYIRIQLRRLDASRNRLLLKLRNKIFHMQQGQNSSESYDSRKRKSVEQIFYGNPFSYYYQVLKHKR